MTTKQILEEVKKEERIQYMSKYPEYKLYYCVTVINNKIVSVTNDFDNFELCKEYTNRQIKIAKGWGVKASFFIACPVLDVCYVAV